MTLTQSTASNAAADETESSELVAFRTEVREWLEANAKRRRHDTSEFKRRVSVTHQSTEDELAHVETCKAWQRKIYDAGYAGIAVPVEYGGRGGTPAQQRVFQTEAARYEIDTGVFSVGIAMVVPTLLAFGSEEQKREHLPAMLRGDRIWCQLFSEP
ncbi:MAG: acyl-CoA dehydrogenase family protein, partial [Acidimicrobiia bacterium]|nr:acyl-CoA dehydrogenase family protein [Acidimicrobiia bacterium]